MMIFKATVTFSPEFPGSQVPPQVTTTFGADESDSSIEKVCQQKFGHGFYQQGIFWPAHRIAFVLVEKTLPG